MLKNKLVIYFTTLLLVFGFVIPVFASTVTVDFTTDKVSYSPGSTVSVTGNVLKDGQAGKGTHPILQIYSSTNELKQVKQWSDSEIGTNGSISTSIKLGSTYSNGTYSLKITAGGVVKTNEITISGNAPTGTISNLATNKSEYNPNEMVQISGTTLIDDKPESRAVNIKIEKDNVIITEQEVTSNASGAFTASYHLATDAAAGTYNITASIVGMNAIATSVFTIKPVTTTPTDPGTPPGPGPGPGPNPPPITDPPVELLDVPTVDAMSSESTVITGKSKPDTTIIITDKNQLNLTGKTAANGTFSIALTTKLKEGTKLFIKAISTTGVESKETEIVVLDKTAPTKPIVKGVSDADTKVTGKAEAGSKVTIKSGAKVIKIGTADQSGNFTIQIAKQKANTILSVTATDEAGNTSATATTKVIDKTPPAIPTVKAVKASSKSVTGKAEAGSTIYVKVGKKIIGTATVNSKGVFTVKIKNQKAGTTLVIYAKDKAGNTSKSKMVKVSK